MVKILSLFIGGGLGTICRYYLSSRSTRLFNTTFPIGTTIVNLTGSFIIGFLWAITEIANVSSTTRAFIFIGFLGGYTTFSTFMLENLNLIRGNESKTAIFNILFNNVVGVILVLLGFILGKSLINFFRR